MYAGRAVVGMPDHRFDHARLPAWSDPPSTPPLRELSNIDGKTWSTDEVQTTRGTYPIHARGLWFLTAPRTYG
jgi:hypothetical protein